MQPGDLDAHARADQARSLKISRRSAQRAA
jgi:hypothetical protein